MTPRITYFRVFEDASGISALVEVSLRKQKAVFSVTVTGDVENPSVNQVGSGFSCRMTSRAAQVARKAVTKRAFSETSEEWRAAAKKMYSA